jgi:hypothetical protein
MNETNESVLVNPLADTLYSNVGSATLSAIYPDGIARSKIVGDSVIAGNPICKTIGIPLETPAKFQKDDIVLHVKSEGLYKIILTPDDTKIESTGERSYVYMGVNKRHWVRPQKEMEDGRFHLASGETDVVQTFFAALEES